MGLQLITPPDPIFTVAEAKRHLSVLHTDDDLYIDGLLGAVTGAVDGPEGFLGGRCLGPQTWDWRLDAVTGPPWYDHPAQCWRPWLELPLRPVISVDLIEYVDTAGDVQAWTDYQVMGAGEGVIGPARIQPTDGTSWPNVKAVADAVRIRLTCGYSQGNGESPEIQVEAVPSQIKAALLLMLGDLFHNRETAGEPSGAVQALLAPFKIWR